MQNCVKPSVINGIIQAPPSKSMIQRLLAISLLTSQTIPIENPAYSSDTAAAKEIVDTLRTIPRVGDTNTSPIVLNCGESGLSLRMFTPIAALWNKPFILAGKDSLFQRPVGMIEEPLRTLGAEVNTRNGFPPVSVRGPIEGGDVIVDGSVSSQFLTGLFMALPLLQKDSLVQVKQLKSKPYIAMTIALLKDFGIRIETSSNYEEFRIKGRQDYRYKGNKDRKETKDAKDTYPIEGDWSGASFMLVAGAIGGTVTVNGLNTQSFQADRSIIDVLKSAGAIVEIDGSKVTVTRPGNNDQRGLKNLKHLNHFAFDATHCPDLFPPLAVLACHCSGTSIIEGVERLKHKESDRAASIQELILKLGGRVRVEGNLMQIEGGPLTGGEVDSFNDHRIAMAAAIAGINAINPVTINRSQCVEKSYPRFFEDLKHISHPRNNHEEREN